MILEKQFRNLELYPETVELDITIDDIEKSSSYRSINNCILARAAQRKFGTTWVTCGGTFIYVGRKAQYKVESGFQMADFDRLKEEPKEVVITLKRIR